MKACAAEKSPPEWKYAILCLVQAVELSLKELLRRQHPLLVFVNVDNPKNTVTVGEALKRLKKAASFDLMEDDEAILSVAKKHRDDMMHYKFDMKVEWTKPAFAKLFSFLVDFHKLHLNSPLNRHIPREIWNAGVKIKEHGNELYKRAQKRMVVEQIDSGCLLACPQCGWRAIVPNDDADQGICYVCGNTEELIFCQHCNKTMTCVEIDEDANGKEYCRDCFGTLLDAADSWYHEMKDEGRI